MRFLVTPKRDYVIDSQISRDAGITIWNASLSGDFSDFKEAPHSDLVIGIFEANSPNEAMLLRAHH